jgi:hypothetical protein
MATLFAVNNFLLAPGTALTMTGPAAPALSAVFVKRGGNSSATLSYKLGLLGYTAFTEHEYVVQIHAVTDGSFSSSLYRWSDDGGVTWVEQNIPAAANQPDILSNGVQFTFTPGPMNPQFAVGDEWRWKILLPYGVATLIDGSREGSNECRTSTINSGDVRYFIFTFTGPSAPSHFIIMDHNFRSTDALRLQASNASDFSALVFNSLLPWQANKIWYQFSSSSATYWRLQATAGSAIGYWRISELYLGDANSFDIPFRIGFSRVKHRLFSVTDESVLARGQAAAGIIADSYEIEFGYRRSGSGQDLAQFQTIWNLINNIQAGTVRPFFFAPMSTDLTEFGLYHWANDLTERHQFLDRYDVPISLTEVVRTAA